MTIPGLIPFYRCHRGEVEEAVPPTPSHGAPSDAPAEGEGTAPRGHPRHAVPPVTPGSWWWCVECYRQVLPGSVAIVENAAERLCTCKGCSGLLGALPEQQGGAR